jgi:broad specificity phosphatase PhoE
MRLLLIRHGQTIDNVYGRLGTSAPGPELTGLGQEQAAAIPGALRDDPIEAIYASNLIRTQLTAEPLSSRRGLRVNVADELREIRAGDLEGRSDLESVRAYIGTIFAWRSDPDARIPGGENGREFLDRFNGTIDDIAARHDGTVAVVTHGAAIRTWASWVPSNLPSDFGRMHPVENTAMVVVTGSPADGWTVTSWAGEPVGGEELEDASAPDPTGSAEAG